MKSIRLLSIGLGAFALLAVATMGTAAAKTELLVYTAVEADELAKFKGAFEKANPDIEIKWVRDSTGIVTAKLRAEPCPFFVARSSVISTAGR